ncbi:MAG: hypothetical protein Q9179_004861, partial [Wetmoreana sp. 5 TL-2023]
WALLSALDREAARMHAANHLVRARNELLENMRVQGVQKRVLLEGQWTTGGPPGEQEWQGRLMEGIPQKVGVTVAVMDRELGVSSTEDGRGQEQEWGDPFDHEQMHGEGLGISMEQQQQERDGMEMASASRDQGADEEQVRFQDRGKGKQVLRGNENGIIREHAQAQREKEKGNGKGVSE